MAAMFDPGGRGPEHERSSSCRRPLGDVPLSRAQETWLNVTMHTVQGSVPFNASPVPAGTMLLSPAIG